MESNFEAILKIPRRLSVFFVVSGTFKKNLSN